MVVYKVVNDVFLSEIDPYFSGNEDSIQTYGKGSYFTKNKNYSNEYIFHSYFSVLLTYELEESKNVLAISSEDLPCMANIGYLESDDSVWLENKKDFVSIFELSQNASAYDFVHIDNEKQIIIIPPGRFPSLNLLNCEIISSSKTLIGKLKEKGINYKSINKHEFNSVDLILQKKMSNNL